VRRCAVEELGPHLRMAPVFAQLHKQSQVTNHKSRVRRGTPHLTGHTLQPQVTDMLPLPCHPMHCTIQPWQPERMPSQEVQEEGRKTDVEPDLVQLKGQRTRACRSLASRRVLMCPGLSRRVSSRMYSTDTLCHSTEQPAGATSRKISCPLLCSLVPLVLRFQKLSRDVGGSGNPKP